MVKKNEQSELEQLRIRNAELEAKVKSQKLEPFEEIRQISIKNRATTGDMTIKTTTDHKKVSLYHSNGFHIGKRIPMIHPNDLTTYFERFKGVGVILSPHKPTDAEIEAYKQTEEYKNLLERQKTLKPHRYKKQTPDETARIIAQFAKIVGVKPEEAIQLKPQEAVR